MTSTTIDLHAQVRELAQATNRQITKVLTEAVTHYMEWDQWFRAEVEKGRRSAEMGPLTPANEVRADFLCRGFVTSEALTAAEAEDAQELA